MTDKYRIDGHKLAYHPLRVAEFLKAGDEWSSVKSVYPIYVELSPVGACNHRCRFCAYDYIGYQPQAMDGKKLISLFEEMGRLGVKSIHLAGEGEPLLHKGIVEAINAGYKAGLDFGVTTNATLLTEQFIDKALGDITWLKASINAGTSATYDKIHRGKQGDFERVIANLQAAVEYRRDHALKTTIGAQAILLPENADEMEELARVCRDEIGLDYLVIKPYSHHLSSKTERYKDIDYADYLGLEEPLSQWASDDFSVVFRAHTMRKYAQDISARYSTCYSTPVFWAHIMTNGELYSCPAYLSETRFSLGNVFEDGFKGVWEGDKRKLNFDFIRHQLDISECRRNCRMDEVNRYLYELVEESVPHVNFI